MNETVIRIIALADGEHTEHSGRYLRDYDPDAYKGRGRIRSTPDLDHAQRFPDKMSAMELWRKQSTTVPLRPDGKPNRPLTAYTCEFLSPLFPAPEVKP